MHCCTVTVDSEPLGRRTWSAEALAELRRVWWNLPPGSIVHVDGYELAVTDGPNAYMQFKDVFVRGIYRFAAARPDPLIIDGGSNMGISIVGFKRDHPRSRIIAFEPDPVLADLLTHNLRRNALADGVELVQAGLGRTAGAASFLADGSAGGQLADSVGEKTVRVVRLSDYLDRPVDFLKLNIEGRELEVLEECAQRNVLANVREMVVEYHGWPRQPQRLGDLLNLLDRQGFRYLVHDFDSETCTITKPPFRHRPKSAWFCLVHAKRP